EVDRARANKAIHRVVDQVKKTVLKRDVAHKHVDEQALARIRIGKVSRHLSDLVGRTLDRISRQFGARRSQHENRIPDCAAWTRPPPAPANGSTYSPPRRPLIENTR